MSSLRIFIVDDRQENLQFLKDYLEHQGHHIRTAMSGGDALHAMSLTPPDVCLLDFEMPDMDGREVLLRMRSLEALTHVPVVMVSAHPPQDIEDDCLKAGAYGVLGKPIRLRNLKEYLLQFEPLQP
jgi:CheY-like chemotaxis protein